MERNDYLATIRRLEREGQLLHSLLERMVPLVRRDCNYSNLDRLKKEAVWDEDSATWRLPDVTVQKTTLPSGGAYAYDRGIQKISELKFPYIFFLSCSSGSKTFSLQKLGSRGWRFIYGVFSCVHAQYFT